MQCLHALAGLSARERNRLKRLAKQNQKRGAPPDALPTAKRAKAEANGSSTVRQQELAQPCAHAPRPRGLCRRLFVW